MRVLKIDHNISEKILREATRKVASARTYRPQSSLNDSIATVIAGTHLTFRYVLLTGLLAKATEPKANPLCLQAGAPLKGAYDARSLCHKVIVPHEQELLAGKLGGSNEPFLNKPARFTHLALGNAVRKGSDLEALKLVISILSSQELNKSALPALHDCIYHVLQRPERAATEAVAHAVSAADDSAAIKAMLHAFLSQSHEGETAVIAVGALLKRLHAAQPGLLVKVHPTNQAGSSSREICDIDITANGVPLMGVEVKDKNYSQHDIAHAVNKATANQLTKMLFIEGRSAKKTPAYAPPEGFNLHVLGIDAFVDTAVAALIPVSLGDFAITLKNTAVEIRAKDATHAWLLDCIVGAGI